MIQQFFATIFSSFVKAKTAHPVLALLVPLVFVILILSVIVPLFFGTGTDTP